MSNEFLNVRDTTLERLGQEPPDLTLPAINELITTLGGRAVTGTEPAGDPVPRRALPAPPLTPEAKRRLGFAVRLSDISAERREVMEQRYKIIVERAAAFPSHEEGLDAPDVDAYFAAKGLVTAPTTVLTPQGLFDFVQTLKDVDYINSDLNEWCKRIKEGSMDTRVNPPACYIPRLRRIVVVRPEGKLTEYDRYSLTYNLAHEKAHSTGIIPPDTIMYTEATDETNDVVYSVYNARSGFYVRVREPGKEWVYRNGFIEESYADLSAAGYIKDREIKSLWLDQRTTYRQNGIELPSIYAMPNYATSTVRLIIGAYGAYGMELISEKRPDLMAALDESRKGIQGLREVGKIIRSVGPELYSKLQKLNRNEEDFLKGLLHVKNALGIDP